MSVLIDDTFAGSTLDPAWTKRGVTTANEAFNNPGLSSTLSSGQGYLRTIPAGDLNARLNITTFSGGMTGVWIMDGSGNGVGATFYGNPNALILTTISGYSYAGSFTQIGTGHSAGIIRLTKTGAAYTAAYSLDNGSTWSAETPSLSPVFTPTVIGYGSWSGTNTITAAEFTVSNSAVGNIITVTNPGSLYGILGSAVNYAMAATDSATGQTLTWTAAGLPNGLSINSTTGVVTGTPTLLGAFTATITATDTTTAFGSASFMWSVNNAVGTISGTWGIVG